MRGLIIACCIVILGSFTVVEAQSIKPRAFDPLMSKLLKVTSISNHDPGFAGNNEFYKLSKEFLKTHDSADFRRMASNRNPIVRAMGLLCLAQTDPDQGFPLLLFHWTDQELVFFHRGCLLSQITVGEFVQALFVNPHFLDPTE